MKNYYVYIMTNVANTVLYIGVTGDIRRRVNEHRLEVIEGFTKKYTLTKLIYVECYSNIKDAIAREKQLKGWTRKKKDSLIQKANPSWDELTI